MLAGVRQCFNRKLYTNIHLSHQLKQSRFANASGIMSKRKPEKRAENSTKRQKRAVVQPRFDGSHEAVLLRDIKHLRSLAIDPKKDEQNDEAAVALDLPAKLSEIEVRISELSSTGDAIGFAEPKDHAFVVPFALPGELIKAKVVRSDEEHKYSITDFIEVLEPSPRRDAGLIKCSYFAKCSGCQFQMTPYEDQLNFKRTVIEKAYRNFSDVPIDTIPSVSDTIGSPLQFGYRTKLTPHFDGPPGVGFKNKKKETFKTMPPFGFMQKNTRWTIDIEDCPIGTDAVRAGLRSERERLAKEFASYSRGATILLRESTERKPVSILKGDAPSSELGYDEVKTCITNSNAMSTEYVDSHIFTNPAGSFFQNNNSVLPLFTQYISDRITKIEEQHSHEPLGKPLVNLVDAYCGSGLFTIMLSSLFKSSIGVDISEASIKYAAKNAELNKVDNAKFIAATASRLFEAISFDPEETLVVIDPPRKGCDEDFLRQLLRFGPRQVVYVSCNVHTQARDVGVLVKGIEACPTHYKLDSLQGFDFFPQTGHVESVAFLSKQG